MTAPLQDRLLIWLSRRNHMSTAKALDIDFFRAIEVHFPNQIVTNKLHYDGMRAGQKTAYMPCNDYDNNPRNYEEIQLGHDKLNTVTTFKYLGSIFDSNGGAERDINNRVKLAWMKWKQLTGVLCDKKSTHQAERQGV